MNIDKLDNKLEVSMYARLLVDAIEIASDDLVDIFNYEDTINSIPQSIKSKMFSSRDYEFVCFESSKDKLVEWVHYIKYDKKKDIFRWMSKSCNEPCVKHYSKYKNFFDMIYTIAWHGVDQVFLDRLRRLAE